MTTRNPSWVMTREEATALAVFLERLRRRVPATPWDKPGIEDALMRARDRAPAPALTRAAVRACENPKNRTPAIIGLDGPHWRETTEADRPRRPRTLSHEWCSVCGLREAECVARWSQDHAYAPSIAVTVSNEVKERAAETVRQALRANRIVEDVPVAPSTETLTGAPL